MLHDNMNISRLMVHARRVEEARAKRKSRDVKEQNHLMEVIQRIGLTYKTRLDLRSKFQIKSLLSSKRLGVIGYLILNSRAKKVLIHQMISLHMTSVENVIFASAW